MTLYATLLMHIWPCRWEVGAYHVHFIQKIARSNLICGQMRASIIMDKGVCVCDLILIEFLNIVKCLLYNVHLLGQEV